MNTRTRLAGSLLAGTIIFTACGGDSVPIAQAPDVPAAEAAVVAPVLGGIATTAGVTDLGEILVGEDGLTLYGFTNDIDATSACYGTCADAWPPVIVGQDFEVAPGLDTGIFATTVRDDGSLQLVAGKWPLYFFAGDAAPGDVNGQGSGDVWFAIDTEGILITDGDGEPAAAVDQPADDESVAALAPSLIGVGGTEIGEVLVGPGSLSLYGFLNDVDGRPTCEGACADAWPPILVDGPELPADLDPAVFSVVQRPDGTHQLRAGVWPLYLFAGDAQQGDVNGQGSGDVWFLAAPDGSLIGAPGVGDAAAAEESSSGY
ncbi:MAG: hypothetical protein AAF480_02995 [Actinomycetota bacterium]